MLNNTFPVVETTGYIGIPDTKAKHSLRFQPRGRNECPLRFLDLISDN